MILEQKKRFLSKTSVNKLVSEQKVNVGILPLLVLKKSVFADQNDFRIKPEMT